MSAKEPKYLQIENDLRDRIISGKFENGDRFYTEAQLADYYKVSSITVIRALKELVRDGYLVRKQGKGTFVSRARKGKMVKFSDVEIFPTAKDQVTVLSLTKGNEPAYLEKLGLSKIESYYKIVRIRKADGKPYIYHQSYIPSQFILDPQADLQDFSSIYKRFNDDFDIHMTKESFQEINQVAFPTPAAVAQSLGIKTSEPTILQIKTTKRALENQIYEYTETYKHWEYYKFEITSPDL